MAFKEVIHQVRENVGAVAAALARFFGETLGNPNPVYPEGSIQSIEDTPTPIPGSEWE